LFQGEDGPDKYDGFKSENEVYMKITVIGASRGTGALAVSEALHRGHEVTAFARSPQKLAITDEKLTLLAGDFHIQADVDRAVEGQDAVIVTASATTLKGFKENPYYFSKGTDHVISSMERYEVRKLVVLSALGVGDSRAAMGFLVRKLLLDLILRRPFEDHERQEDLVRKSNLDWVIARPGRLTDGPALGKTVKSTTLAPMPGAISRADLAAFLVEAAEQDKWNRTAVHLGG
jgi:putative NADH-flavin reductase